MCRQAAPAHGRVCAALPARTEEAALVGGREVSDQVILTLDAWSPVPARGCKASPPIRRQSGSKLSDRYTRKVRRAWGDTALENKHHFSHTAGASKERPASVNRRAQIFTASADGHVRPAFAGCASSSIVGEWENPRALGTREDLASCFTPFTRASG